MQKRTNMVVSGSSGSVQTPSVPSANSTNVRPPPGVTSDAAAIHISEDPRLLEEARIQKKRKGPLLVYQRRRLWGNKKEQAAATTIADPAASPNTSTPAELLKNPVESVVRELDLINQNPPEILKENFICKKMATELEERVAILEKEVTVKADEPEAKVKSVEEAADRRIHELQEKIDTELEERVAVLDKDFTAKADELEAQVKSVDEAADRCIQEQQEKIDTLANEKALITQELQVVSHELEQHKKVLEKERAQFEVEKKKIAVLADVTATYNLLISFVVSVPDFDYTLLGEDIAHKVEEIRLKLAKEESKSAVKEAGIEGQVGSRS
ncbi:hypothetical protein AgCh_008823 [Apium graveolens]